MKDKAKNRIKFLLRFLVSAGLIIYVCSLINFSDLVEFELKDGSTIEGKIVEENKNTTVIEIEEGEKEISNDEIKERTDKPGFFTILEHLNFQIFIPVFLCFITGIVVTAFRWQQLLKVQDVNLGFAKVLKLTFLGLFFNNFMIGMTGGDLVKAYFISKETDKKTNAIVTVAVDRLVGIIALACLSGTVMLFDITNEAFRSAAIVVYGFIGCFVLGAIVFYSKRLRKILLLNKVLKFLPFQKILREADSAFLIYKDNKRVILGCFLLSFVNHSLAVLINFGYSQALGIEGVEVYQFFIFIPVSLIIAAIPVSLAGWGTGEAAYSYFLKFIGVPKTQSIILSVLFRLTNVVWSLTGGVLLVLGGKKVSVKEMEEELGEEKDDQ